jgi:hypothetical protein
LSVAAALQGNTTGANNVAVGTGALQANTTASNNTAIGYNAGLNNVTGANNLFVGMNAGNATTSGNNTIVGRSAGESVSSGGFNTLIGNLAGANITSGAKNTVLGRYDGNQGGLDIRTASNNIVLSDGDGNPRIYNNGSWTHINSLASTDATGIRVINGDGSLYVAKDNSGGAAFGFGAYQNVIFSNNKNIYVQAGSGGVQLTNGATSWTSASDLRLKNVTATYTNALADIAQLEPIKFTWKADSENKPQVGVSAQSVEKVVPEAVDSGLYIKGDDTEYLSVRYTELIPLMIASIQELKAEVDSLKQQLGK